MSARVLDGIAVAKQIREELRPRIDAFTSRAGRPPGLGIVLVGEDPASEIYVRGKLKSAGESGLRADLERLPADASLPQLLAVVDRLNRSDAHDGILVQSPLPKAMGPGAERRVFDAVDPAKDVDGFHPLNVGRLVQNRESLVACTPSGVIELLERSGVGMAGAHAVVIGRSDIVGKPMAILLLHRNATVTICHSRTVDLPRLAAQADILVAAIGRAAFVTREFVKPGAVVIDVGTNRDEHGKLCGDVDTAGVAEVAGWISPVPGGVGPMTVTMLLVNTLEAAERTAASRA